MTDHPPSPAPESWTAARVVAALREHFTPATGPSVGEWALLPEVPALDNPTGADLGYLAWRDGESLEDHEARRVEHAEAAKVRSIDVLLLRNWSGGAGRERIAVEVKVARPDFFRDTAAKRAPWETLTHRFAYAVPAGLVAPDEVPDGCWLLEVSEQPCVCRRHVGSPRRVHWHPKVRGVRRRPKPFGEHLVGYLARRASDAERRLAQPDQLDGDQVAADLAELRKVQLRTRALEQQREQLKDRLRDLTNLVVEASPQACADCGEQLVPKATRYSSYRWQHRRESATAPCDALRASRADAIVAAGGGDGWEFRYGTLEPEIVRANNALLTELSKGAGPR